MILTSRVFQRREPVRNAKTIYIFCEGADREYQYFQYFRGLDSRINIKVYQLAGDSNNSPTGLYAIACNCLVVSDDNPNPEYEFIEGDEVWFVIDTDKWGQKIANLRASVRNHTGWYIAKSNPCFEIWLCYHHFEDIPALVHPHTCQPLKQYLDQNPAGGFDCRKHPIYISNAIERAEKRYSENDGEPEIGSTQVYNLGKAIHTFCGDKLAKVLNLIQKC